MTQWVKTLTAIHINTKWIGNNCHNVMIVCILWQVNKAIRRVSLALFTCHSMHTILKLWGNTWGGVTSTSLTGGNRFWSRDYAQATTDSMPTCSGKWSWHHRQPATAVLKTRQPNIYYRDARFCRKRDKICQWPTAVQLHTRLYGSREELEKMATFTLLTGLSV